MHEDLTGAETHFAFGKNWAAYAEKITETEIDEAEKGLQRLMGGRLDGLRFLDIGCGSGLHALAALRLGAREVVAVDIDVDSVATTQAVLARYAPGQPWRAEKQSVFDLTSATFGYFDVVYSWGVLHHTGNLDRALRQAAALVEPGGRVAFALYRRVWTDWFWRVEKPWYAHASLKAQKRARVLYCQLYRVRLAAKGQSFVDYVARYNSNRGMDFHHDVHDWLGGWPYEPISAPEVESLMDELGFVPERVLVGKGRIFGRDPGFFGSGCDEYVYRRA